MAKETEGGRGDIENEGEDASIDFARLALVVEDEDFDEEGESNGGDRPDDLGGATSSSKKEGAASDEISEQDADADNQPDAATSSADVEGANAKENHLAGLDDEEASQLKADNPAKSTLETSLGEQATFPSAKSRDARATTNKDTRFRLKMNEIGDEPKVAVFGFKSAGKSWLLHRLRHYIFNECGTQLEPAFRDLPDTGRALEGTSEFEIHEVLESDPWSIIDSPGEFSRLLVQGDIEHMWQLVHVLANASAIIMTIPADVLIFGAQTDGDNLLSDTEREVIARDACGDDASDGEVDEVSQFIKNLRYDYNELKRFAEGLYRVGGVLSFIHSEGIDALDPEQFQKVTWEAVVRHIKSGAYRPVGGMNGLTCPCFVALTKSDRVMSVLFGEQDIPGAGPVVNARKNDMLKSPKTKALRALAERGGFFENGANQISRPSNLVQQMQKNLHTQIYRTFPMSKFDYVSAFFGHDYTDMLEYNHYQTHPVFGVPEMFNWIRGALAIASRGDKRISQQAFARKLHFAIHGIPEPGSASMRANAK